VIIQRRFEMPEDDMRLSSLVVGLLGLIGITTMAVAADRWAELPTLPAMPTATSSGKAPVNGIEMYYATYGKGSPILLIHGGLGHADVWGNQIADLMKDHLVIVADSRGHGRSTRNATAYGYDLMTSDYIALLDFLKVDKVAVVGWSDGGIIGIDMAMNYPTRVTKVFAQAANTLTSGVRADVMTNKTFADYIERSGVDYKRLSPTPDQYDAFVTQISGMWAAEPNWPDAKLAAIKTPIAIVLGDHDEAITREHTDYMAKTIPGAKLVILKDASHFAMLQDPAGYTAAVREFFGP
jgi:pimeloyl-ACP methyl ester carboxylesterase